MVQKVLITGGNKGIGFESARKLGKLGWHILLGARNEQRGTAAVEKLEQEGITAEWIHIDLNDLATIHAAAQYVTEHHTDLNVLINNAGIPGKMDATPLEVTADELKSVIDVNIIGNFEMIKTFTPILAVNKGTILNLTIPSKSSHFFHPFSYTASKSSLNSMIRMFGQYYKKKHIPINIFGLMPGGITTDLNNHMKGFYMRTVDQGAQTVVNVLTDKRNYNGKVIFRFTPFTLFNKK
ncbi:SDR family NAD(P)-dependent oxidoreductase [Staphylococcus simiae]|uniref:SDR family NAD(P)-dependent oxidoreductase n=1 Tax=Staphylococcus simiae TaxID=308354 RepID=UPI001A9A1FEE|nr:SDR family NAD(P)-dependent oxidoreductase [Staphylococcus simiae]MBO1198892.1 SDR family NAD(P)-dependent oxidoreductase [Staphylococcus simiae]MBO1201082.1 SDR family NAD(P)-dependent oxidoreductase [Staphylococcus simiae]MBO1203292.1 SDR family NAD(P)-dependent oxidoreductase [Staphylococcus simiae]MBO1210759.1 SDR family NAD(P)-dependent oxidoreductase [Staphylococcus simiae]MBO1229420.1 SDR family NAD(P)-dependent oxidoreductase [Staphylococcus simiae]